MDKNRIKETFIAISSFVEDLWEVFGNTKKVTPLSLYHRLIQHIKFSALDDMKSSIEGFREFFSSYDNLIIGNEMDKIPRNTNIRFGTSSKVYLEIQKYIYQADVETKDAIRRHLITISTILEPNKEKMAQLERRIEGLDIDANSPEGEFLSNIMEKTKHTMENIEADNPMTAIMGLFNSGVLGEMMSGLESGVQSGQMDMGKLLGTMQSTIGKLIPVEEEKKEEE